MNNASKAFGILMAANFEALVIFFLCHEGGVWLDENYPGDTSWRNKMYLVGIVVIGTLWIRMFKHLVTLSKTRENEPKQESDKTK